jgi:hypothetical protein
LINVSQKLKYHSAAFLMGLRDNSTPRTHILNPGNEFGKILYHWKDKMINIIYEMFPWIKKLLSFPEN